MKYSLCECGQISFHIATKSLRSNGSNISQCAIAHYFTFGWGRIFHSFLPTEPKLWTDSNRHTPSEAFQKSFPFKNYLQSHRCNGILDRFEPPHIFPCRKQGQSEKDAISTWIDSNHHISLKPQQTANTKLLFSFNGQIRTIENQIMTC